MLGAAALCARGCSPVCARQRGSEAVRGSARQAACSSSPTGLGFGFGFGLAACSSSMSSPTTAGTARSREMASRKAKTPSRARPSLRSSRAPRRAAARCLGRARRRGVASRASSDARAPTCSRPCVPCWESGTHYYHYYESTHRASRPPSPPPLPSPSMSARSCMQTTARSTRSSTSASRSQPQPPEAWSPSIIESSRRCRSSEVKKACGLSKARRTRVRSRPA
eukprot:scaffold65774_cov61-Phaeocystis_antarctica.AAC.5